MMKKWMVAAGLLAAIKSPAQKQVTVMQQSWLGLVQQVRLSQHWGLLADAQYRTVQHWAEGNNFLLSRLGGTWYSNSQLQLAGGYAYQYLFAQNGTLLRQEHRLWQQAQWTNSWSRARFQQRVRMEERWREQFATSAQKTKSYQYLWRASMQLQLAYPLTKKAAGPGATALLLAEEALFNLGKAVVYNHFDQNRLSAGFQVQVGSQDQLQATYMRIFQQLAAGSHYRQIHCGRIFYTHTIDLRRKS